MGYPLLFMVAIVAIVVFMWMASIFAVLNNLPKCDECRARLEYADAKVATP